MLNIFTRKMTGMHKYVHNKLNIAWVAGWIVGVDRENRTIQVQHKRGAEWILPISYPRDYVLPARFSKGVVVTTTCHVTGRSDGSDRHAGLRLISIEHASIMDTNATLAFERMRAMKDQADTAELFESKNERISDMSNRAQIAGFVQDVSYVSPTKDKSNSYCQILLRQSKDEGESIPARFIGNIASIIADRVEIGTPILIDGQFAQELKAGEEGQPRLSVTFIKAWSWPQVPTLEHIKDNPEWALEMRNGAGKEGRRRNQATKAASASDESNVAAPKVMEVDF